MVIHIPSLLLYLTLCRCSTYLCGIWCQLFFLKHVSCSEYNFHPSLIWIQISKIVMGKKNSISSWICQFVWWSCKLLSYGYLLVAIVWANITFICQLLKEKIKCITHQAAMIKEPNTQTNTHPISICLFHFNNVGSFQGLASDTPIVL
jgi:hypothetical protein